MANIVAGLFRTEVRRANAAIRAGKYDGADLHAIAETANLPPDQLDQEIADLLSGTHQDIEHLVLRAVPALLLSSMLGRGQKTLDAIKELKQKIKERVDNDPHDEELSIADVLGVFKHRHLLP